MNFTYPKSVTIYLFTIILWLFGGSIIAMLPTKTVVPVYLLTPALGDKNTAIYQDKIESFTHPNVILKPVFNNDVFSMLNKMRAEGGKGIVLISPRYVAGLDFYTDKSTVTDFYNSYPKVKQRIVSEYKQFPTSIPLFRHILVMFYKDNDQAGACLGNSFNWEDFFDTATTNNKNLYSACEGSSKSVEQVVSWLLDKTQLAELFFSINQQKSSPIVNSQGKWNITNEKHLDSMVTFWNFYHNKLAAIEDKDEQVYNRFSNSNDNVYAILAPNSKLTYLTDRYDCTNDNLLINDMPKNYSNLSYFDGMDIVMGKDMSSDVRKAIHHFITGFYTDTFQKEMVKRTGNFPATNISLDELKEAIPINLQTSYETAFNQKQQAQEFPKSIQYQHNLKVLQAALAKAFTIKVIKKINPNESVEEKAARELREKTEAKGKIRIVLKEAQSKFIQ